MFMIRQTKVSWHSSVWFFSKCYIASNKLLHIIDLQVHNGVDRLKNLSSEGEANINLSLV